MSIFSTIFQDIKKFGQSLFGGTQTKKIPYSQQMASAGKVVFPTVSAPGEIIYKSGTGGQTTPAAVISKPNIPLTVPKEYVKQTPLGPVLKEGYLFSKDATGKLTGEIQKGFSFSPVPNVNYYPAITPPTPSTQEPSYRPPVIPSPPPQPPSSSPGYGGWTPPPPHGKSGGAGITSKGYYDTGGGGYIPLSTGQSGSSGLSSGQAAHTGLLGSVSSGGTLLNLMNSKQDNKDKTGKKIVIPKGATLGSLARQYGVSVQDLLSANPNIKNPNLIYAGSSLNIPSSKGVISPDKVSLGEGAVDYSKVQGVDTSILRNPDASKSLTQYLDEINNLIQDYKGKLDEQQPLPEEPMLHPQDLVPTEAPTGFLEEQSQRVLPDKEWLDRFQNIETQTYEDLQRKLGIPDTIKSLEETMRQMQATNDVYQKVIDEIVNNPNLPKSLARRRIQIIQKEQQGRLNALQQQAELLKYQLDLKKEELRDRLGITRRAIERARTQEEQQRDNYRQMISQYVSTGALADFSDDELKELSIKSGYSLSGLKAMRNNVKRGRYEKAIQNLQKMQYETLRQEKLQKQISQPVSTEQTEKPISSLTEIKRFKNTYGWTPPAGFTLSQLLEYMRANPNKTPEQLEEGARQALQIIQQGGKGKLPPNKIYSSEEIANNILGAATPAQIEALKAKADEAGVSSFWRGKIGDIKTYLYKITPIIQEALNRGYNWDEIIEKITQ